MDYRKITAIVPRLKLDKIETELRKHGVTAMSISQVEGVGDYKNLYSENEKVTSCKIEIFADVSDTEEICQTIIDAAHTGMDEDGIIAVLPVEKFYHIKDEK